ncbi:DUF6089 family protein [Pontibacter sp. MBLB2868]|uniref:DUF6089 family protein n=1 Tax=Pontibacter sp. MBLB2868 TaxID=3451555 RepID=UPI003F74D9A1
MRSLCALGLLLTLTMTLVVTDAEAQLFTMRKRYSSIGLSLGAMNYFGDIVPEPNFTSLRFKSTRPNVGINYTRRYRPRISGKVAFHWGRIMGDDMLSASVNEAENMGRFGRNLSFRNDISELSLIGIIDLFENRQTYQRRPDFAPYMFFGVAVFHHNPKAYYENGSFPGITPDQDIPTGWYELQPLGTEGQYAEGDYPEPYKKIGISIPFGLGVRYKLDRNWDLSLELGWRKTFTDYLDDSSTGYAWKNDILNGGGSNPKAAALLSDRSAMSGFGTTPDPSGTPYAIITFPDDYGTPGNQRRGNRSDDDWYITTSLTIHYILNPGVRTPKFR